jgi:hypothetical protein
LNQEDSIACLGAAASHLPLIRTNSGYGTVLTAACAREGCTASGLVWFGLADKYLLNRLVSAYIFYLQESYKNTLYCYL